MSILKEGTLCEEGDEEGASHSRGSTPSVSGGTSTAVLGPTMEYDFPEPGGREDQSLLAAGGERLARDKDCDIAVPSQCSEAAQQAESPVWP